MNTEIIIIVSNFITAIAGFFLGRRKQEADTDNAVIKNLELAVNLYGKIIDDLKTEIQGLNIKIQDLEKKIDELHAENKRLKGHL
jgi:peptidoglycan hydrolase CwlO-like protein